MNEKNKNKSQKRGAVKNIAPRDIVAQNKKEPSGKEKQMRKKGEARKAAASEKERKEALTTAKSSDKKDEGKNNKKRAYIKKKAPKSTGGIMPERKRQRENKAQGISASTSVNLPDAPRGRERAERHKLKIISLGGLAEIGKNITVFEYGEDIVIIDAGLAFPDDEMLGIDLVIPDFSYLVKNAHKIRGLLITHGHEDHIGAVSYLLQSIDIPVYGTRLSLGIIEGKLDENRPPFEPRLYTVDAGDTVSLGVFKAEFVHVNHSIADACAIALRTPVGIIYHSGDFKLDVSPIDGKMMDLTRIGELGREGVTMLLCESTNAERAGYTPSERTVGGSLDRIFMQSEGKRVIIATFSSNVHRVQQIINASSKYERKVAVLGRSMVNVIGAALELGYMEIPDDCLIDISEIKKYPPEKITLITTGSQGEPMSALYRIAFGEHPQVRISSNDVVVLSSSAIPGNEKLVGKIINALVKNGVKVVNDSIEDVHVSGHACREEIKLLIALLKPKYFMPIHGEYRHLYANKEIAEFMGIPSNHIFISEIGKVLEVGRKSAEFSESVPSGNVLVDGSGVGEIGSVVLRDRKHLSEDGLVIIVASVDMREGLLISGPDIVSRGFVYVKESQDLVEKTRKIAEGAVDRALNKNVRDFAELKKLMRDDVAKFIYKETKRKPMVLPIIMDV